MVGLGLSYRRHLNFLRIATYIKKKKSLIKKPKHKRINEYLGELYFVTNRVDLAKERLSILKSCNCEEYKDLELIIKTRGDKNY